MRSVFCEVGKRNLNTVSINFSVKMEQLQYSRVLRQENTVMDPVRLGNRNQYVGEGQQLSIRPDTLQRQSVEARESTLLHPSPFWALLPSQRT
jgi:hypothetical protein